MMVKHKNVKPLLIGNVDLIEIQYEPIILRMNNEQSSKSKTTVLKTNKPFKVQKMRTQL